MGEATTKRLRFNQTLAGGLVPQCLLHGFKHVLIGTSQELLVCSDSDLGILSGGAVQLQQHRPLRKRKLLSVTEVRLPLTSSPPPQLIMDQLYCHVASAISRSISRRTNSHQRSSGSAWRLGWQRFSTPVQPRDRAWSGLGGGWRLEPTVRCFRLISVHRKAVRVQNTFMIRSLDINLSIT